ncbi:MAG: UDP-N-acetylmuramoyl-tripeptide--D-alanyl-D-alanine ligase [Patescibacteria group bacterium]
MFWGRQFSKCVVQKLLEKLVQVKLRRTRPVIIGVTGSFGKTTTKEAVYEVLKTKWKVYRNPKSLNTEIGLLLAILEQPSGFRSPLKWTAILARAAANAFFGKKYDFLILEYGADKPGDIAHLTSVVKPHVGIITHIARVHQNKDQFKNEQEVFEEKKHLVTCLKKGDMAILNADDEQLKKLDGKLLAKTFWFSANKHDKADIWLSDAKNTPRGFSATLHKGSQKEHWDFTIAGAFHASSLMPALLCGTLYNIPLREGIDALQSFQLPPGRMTIIEGKNGATLLDSTYNASPETVKQALGLLKDFPGKRKIAVLGSMNELGDYTQEGHQEVGEQIGSWVDMLVTVGDFAKIIAESALKNGFPKARIKILSVAQEAGEFL